MHCVPTRPGLRRARRPAAADRAGGGGRDPVRARRPRAVDVVECGAGGRARGARGRRSRAAARSALPDSLEQGLEVTERDSVVEVVLRLPLLVPSLHTPLPIAARAHLGDGPMSRRAQVSGQASIELIGAVPVVVVAGVALFQLLAVGAAFVLAGNRGRGGRACACGGWRPVRRGQERHPRVRAHTARRPRRRRLGPRLGAPALGDPRSPRPARDQLQRVLPVVRG